MKQEQEHPKYKLYKLLLFNVKLVVVLSTVMLFYLFFGNPFPDLFKKRELDLENLGYYPQGIDQEEERIENGIHYPSGMKVGEGFEITRATCTACHSAKLVTQNRATYQGWKDMLTWMQQTQGLWDMGENEELILNYLAKNYAPEEKGRRANLENIQWYKLDQK